MFYALGHDHGMGPVKRLKPFSVLKKKKQIYVYLDSIRFQRVAIVKILLTKRVMFYYFPTYYAKYIPKSIKLSHLKNKRVLMKSGCFN